MIRSLENLIGYRIAAANGDIGTVEDFYFTDDDWQLRYLVVAAGGWLSRRHVLLAFSAVDGISDEKREVVVKLTRESVYASPDTESDKPVTRQKEILLAEYYGWKLYWSTDPFLGVDLPSDRMEIEAELPGANPHLRSFREVSSYETKAPGLECFVLDMIADDVVPSIVSMVIARGRGRYFPAELLPVDQIEGIDWTNRRLDLRSGAADTLQPFDSTAGVNPKRTAHYSDYLGHLHHTTVLNDERN